ncbi:MAG: class A beta-lactamase-related serine hydrolase [Sphingobacteriales bacterium]|nr:MAG: class A beta-lactamase-related serine hydrolase [Sphingobacteriales bacterium]
MFKKILPITIFSVFLILNSCRDADIQPTDAETCQSGFGTIEDSVHHPRAKEFQAVLDKYVKLGLPGISVTIRDSSGLWRGSAGMADIVKNTKFTPCTVAKTASLTKIMIAALTMKLVEDGTLNLDDKISKWIPQDIISKIENADKATLRNLLNHTTGIYDHITGSDFYLAVLNHPDRKWKQEELLEFVYGKPAAYPFGEANYSNTNTLLVSMILDKASGRNHGDLLKERIFEPLGMNNTFYYYYQDLPKNGIAQGYFDLYNNNTLVNVSNYNTGSGNGYTGVYSNVIDLQVFIEALFKSKTLLKQSSLNEMMKFASTVEFHKYLGMGMIKDYIYDEEFVPGEYAYDHKLKPDEYAYGHRGRDLGYSADMFYFPVKGITLAALVNYGTDANSALRPKFYDFKYELADVALHKK